MAEAVRRLLPLVPVLQVEMQSCLAVTHQPVKVALSSSKLERALVGSMVLMSPSMLVRLCPPRVAMLRSLVASRKRLVAATCL